MSTSKLNNMAMLIEVIILWQLFTTSQIPFDYIAQSYNADGAKQERGVSTKGMEQLKYSSSIVNEVIRTIQTCLFFLRKYFEHKKSIKTQNKQFPPSQKFICTKNCCLFCFLFACFCFFGLLLFDSRFCVLKYCRKNQLT